MAGYLLQQRSSHSAETRQESCACRGIERALDQIEAERGQQTEAALNTGPALPRSDSAKKEEVKRSVMREKRALAWKHLSLNERDVLTVLSAVCKACLFHPSAFANQVARV